MPQLRDLAFPLVTLFIGAFIGSAGTFAWLSPRELDASSDELASARREPAPVDVTAIESVPARSYDEAENEDLADRPRETPARRRFPPARAFLGGGFDSELTNALDRHIRAGDFAAAFRLASDAWYLERDRLAEGSEKRRYGLAAFLSFIARDYPQAESLVMSIQSDFAGRFASSGRRDDFMVSLVSARGLRDDVALANLYRQAARVDPALVTEHFQSDLPSLMQDPDPRFILVALGEDRSATVARVAERLSRVATMRIISPVSRRSQELEERGQKHLEALRRFADLLSTQGFDEDADIAREHIQKAEQRLAENG